MPILSCYVDQRTLMTLERISAETGRDIEELAEAAISNEAIKSETEHRAATAPGNQP